MNGHKTATIMSDLQVTSAVVAVVDDDPRIRALLEDELIDEGVTPVLCASGHEMLESIKKHDIQLILLDLMMPGMDGFQCLKELRAQDFQGVVVIVTALSDDAKRREALSEGASDYVVKPNLFSSLPGILDRYIKSKQ